MDRMRVAMLAAVGLGALAGLGGCSLPIAPLYFSAVSTVGAMGGTQAGLAMSNGPRATFVNDSAMPISVRYWVGRRDTTAHAGVADIRTADDLAFTAKPGEFFITQLGRPWWVTGMSDAVVRVRLEAWRADGESAGVTWLQLDQPQPFTFAAAGESAEDLEFRRFGGGAMAPLPSDQWIDSHHGPFPVDQDLALSAR